jgi:hypothetical protein
VPGARRSGGGTRERLAGELTTTGARALAVEAETTSPPRLPGRWPQRYPGTATAARRLFSWWCAFVDRPPLLPGDEVAALLGLPRGPERAEAVRRLRLAQARGEIRTAAQARRRLGV